MNIQEKLSQIKKALTSDTAKSIGTGLAATGAAALVGGSGGVAALGNAMESVKRREQERDLDKIRKIKADLEIEKLKQDVEAKKLENQIAIWNVGAKKITDRVKNLPSLESVVNSKKSKSEKDFKTSDIPITSTMPGYTPEEDLQDNINKAIGKGREEGAEIGAALGPIGPDKFKGQLRRELAAEIRSKNLNPEQEKGMWQEINERVMPGFRAKNQAMVDENSNVSAVPIQDQIGRGIAMGTGAFIGTSMGMPWGGFGAIPGGVIGGRMGELLYDAVADYSQRSIDTAPKSDSQNPAISSQALQGQEPALPGIEAYQDWPPVVPANTLATEEPLVFNATQEPITSGPKEELSFEAQKIVNGISSVAGPQDIVTLMTDLPRMPEFASLQPIEQRKVLAEIRKNITRKALSMF
jgi:hypothetical protein